MDFFTVSFALATIFLHSFFLLSITLQNDLSHKGRKHWIKPACDNDDACKKKDDFMYGFIKYSRNRWPIHLK